MAETQVNKLRVRTRDQGSKVGKHTQVALHMTAPRNRTGLWKDLSEIVCRQEPSIEESACKPPNERTHTGERVM